MIEQFPGAEGSLDEATVDTVASVARQKLMTGHKKLLSKAN